MLELNPARRPTASAVLAHPYFAEDPRPKAAAMFPTFPSKAGRERRRRRVGSPCAPRRGDAPPRLEGDFGGIFGGGREEGGKGFALKMG